MSAGGWLSELLFRLGVGRRSPAGPRLRSSARVALPAPGKFPAAGPGRVATETPAGSPARAPTSAFLRQRIRERFLGCRFPGVPHGVEDLGRTGDVIRTARLFFEDGDVDRACEWLAFASDTNPDERLWLAQMEILYLRHRAGDYVALAADFRRRFPEAAAWVEVARLGRRLAPAEALFAGAPTADTDTHYGPWPQVQNWIEAPYDLTGDVLAAEFNAAMGGTCGMAIAARAS